MKPVILFWSGGKDSALALDRIRRERQYDVVALVTTVNEHYRRISMHGVREELVEAQAAAAGLPLHKMYVGPSGTNDEYVAGLRAVIAPFRDRGIDGVAFGDIFLEDLRQWREVVLAEIGVTGIFPLWKNDTVQLAQEFVARGFKAVICCANDAHLGEADAGRPLDARFFASLPADVDPCGENGEYHSFVHDGPVFRRPVAFELGAKVYRPILTSTDEEEDEAAQTEPAIPRPAAHGTSLTKGFWFVDLHAMPPGTGEGV